MLCIERRRCKGRPRKCLIKCNNKAQSELGEMIPFGEGFNQSDLSETDKAPPKASNRIPSRGSNEVVRRASACGPRLILGDGPADKRTTVHRKVGYTSHEGTSVTSS